MILISHSFDLLIRAGSQSALLVPRSSALSASAHQFKVSKRTVQRWAASQESGELETMRLQGRLRRQGGGSKVVLQSLRNAFRLDLEKKLVDKDRTINLPTCVSTINKMLKEVYPNGLAEPEVKHAIRRAIWSYSATPRPCKRPIYMGKDCVSQAVLKSMV